MAGSLNVRRPTVLRVLSLACIALVVALPWATPGAAQDQAGTPEAEVRAVVVSGNEQVDAVTILDAITRTQPGKLLNRDDVQADMRAILNLGYFKSVSVDIQSLSATPAGSGAPQLVRVVFRVVENPVLRRAVVEPEGELGALLSKAGASPQALAALLELPKGQVAHGPSITAQVQELPGKVWQRYGVLVAPDRIDLSDDGTLTVALLPVKVARIDVEGNQKTKSHVITRELSVKPGQVLERGELERSLRRVLMLQLFEEVNADLRGVPDRSDEVAVVVSVKERRTGNVQLGLTWTAGEGPAGFLEVSDSNFLGRAQQVGITLSYGRDAKRYQLSFTEPYLDSAGTSLGFKVGWQSVLTTDSSSQKYFDERYGGEVTLGRPLSEYTRGYLTFANWRTDAPLADRSGWSTEATRGTQRSLKLSTVTDTSDHPFSPSTGQRLRLSADLAGFGGTFRYKKFESTYSHYIPVQLGKSRHVIAARLSLGTLIPEQGTPAPDQELFRLGGAETLRGYDFGKFWGTTMAMGNVEYRFPIVKPVSGVVFFDAGQAWQPGEPVDLQELQWDVGFGVRIDIGALGMLRLDYGMAKDVEGGNFNFSIGQQF